LDAFALVIRPDWSKRWRPFYFNRLVSRVKPR